MKGYWVGFVRPLLRRGMLAAGFEVSGLMEKAEILEKWYLEYSGEGVNYEQKRE